MKSLYSKLPEERKEKVRQRSKTYYEKHKAEVQARCYRAKLYSILKPKEESLAKHGIH